MAINAHAIGRSDPGAVPGGSTINPAQAAGQSQQMRGSDCWVFDGAETGSTGFSKMLAFARCDTAVTGSNSTIANDNRAPVALAA